MNTDLRTQLAEYGRYHQAEQPPVDVTEIIAPLGPVLPIPLETPPRHNRRRVWIAAAAAVMVLMVVGGVAWLSQFNSQVEPVDQQTVTTVQPGELSGTVGVLGPGAWSVAATFTDNAVSEELLRGTAEELRTWPGVLEVALARDAAGWLELTGLDAAECGEGSTEPPCGVGLVALVATPQMALTQVRLESELEMAAITATDVPEAFVDGYVAAARRTPAPELRFDATSLGTEVPLEGPDADAGNMCSVPGPSCLVSVLVANDGLVVQAGLVRYGDGNVSLEVEILGGNGWGGSGSTITDLFIDGNGRGGVLTNLDHASAQSTDLLGHVSRGRAIYVIAGLPLDASAVTLQLADGTPVWQRPVAGMVLLVDRPGTASVDEDTGARATNRFTVLDADGAEIVHITGTTEGPIVTDLRVDPVKAGELQTTDVDATGPVEVAGMTLTWTQAQWGEGSGPRMSDYDGMAATSSGFLGTDVEGRLWRSPDGTTWEEDATISGLEGISVADAGSHILVSGRRTDGTAALLRSEDGETWTDIDLSALSTDEAIEVAMATPSGLTWLRLESGGDWAGVIAIIEGDRIVETHQPPWDTVNCCAPLELVELNGGVVAFQVDFNDPTFSFVYRYFGDGLWSEAQPIPISSHHAQVGDTVLMFDHTNATCCGNLIPGLSQWPLLASNDGINWIEIGTPAAQDVHALQIRAGDSFWVYGPDVGGGGNQLEPDPTSPLWISRDGRTWEPIDILFAPFGFVQVLGDTIYLVSGNAFDGTATYWVGTFSEQ
jgi:hypothetical protein